MNPLLSILIPTIPARFDQLGILLNRLGRDPRVEVLAFADNRRRSVGAKRQGLLDLARGDYVAFVDDDDWTTEDYLTELLPRCASGPDVVSFEQLAIINGVEGRIIFDATCQIDEPWQAGGTARRRPWHVCAWRRTLAQQCHFTDKNYGEDADWVNQAMRLVRSESHIPRVLHTYRYDSAISQAPPPAGK